MSSLKILMQTSPETLARAQHDSLKQHTLEVLDTIRRMIEHERYKEIGGYLFDSPAGDGYGCDNQCINFKYDDKTIDIGQIVESLSRLKERSGK